MTFGPIACDDESDCAAGEICIQYQNKGGAIASECRKRSEDGSTYGTDAFGVFVDGQACVQDCECEPSFGSKCVDNQCR